MVIKMENISASEFKEKCLKLMEVVAQQHEELIITKRGVPIAKLVPIEIQDDPFGYMKNSIVIKDDIVNYRLDEKWDVESDDT